MTITRTGSYQESPSFGEYLYGLSGVGSLQVTNGSAYNLESESEYGPILWVGLNAAGAGTVWVSGSKSTLSLQSIGGAKAGDGAGMQIGVTQGTGTVNVTSGGALRIVDSVSPAFASGVEYIVVGRNSGGNGTLNLDGGIVEVRGNGAYIDLGVGGGSGTLRAANGSVVSVINSASANVVADVFIGSESSTGTASILSSSLVIENRGFGEAYLGVGRFGTGDLTISGAGAETHGVFLYGGSNSGAFADIGRGADGDGEVLITAAKLSLQNRGNGHAGTQIGGGGDAFALIGRDGGTGQVRLDMNGQLQVSARSEAGLIVGLDGGDGSLLASDSTVMLRANGRAFLSVGEGVGASGTATFSEGSAVKIVGNVSLFTIGSGGDGSTVGDVELQGSRLSLSGSRNLLALGSTLGGASSGVGDGKLVLTDRSIIYMGGSKSDIHIGACAGAVGHLSITNDSALYLNGNEPTEVRIGTDGGQGTLYVGKSSFLSNIDCKVTVGSKHGSGLVILEDGGRFGAKDFTVMQNGVVAAGRGELGGGIIFDRGVLDMSDRGLTALSVKGTLTLRDSEVLLDIGAGGNDRILVDGTVRFGVIFDERPTDIRFRLIDDKVMLAKESLVAIRATDLVLVTFSKGSITFDGAGAGFSWVIGESAASANALTLVALNRSDSDTGKGKLNLSGSDDAKVTWTADSGMWSIQGGAWTNAVAHNVGTIIGSDRADTINGTQFTDALKILGGAGGDHITGGSGKNLLNGGDGADYILAGLADDRLFGGGWNDTLVGHGGDDTLQGGAGDDQLRGENGSDVLIGGAGADSMSGYSGNLPTTDSDRFVFLSVSDSPANGGRDTIWAFASGRDKIDLRAFGPGLTFIGSDRFGETALQVRFASERHQLQVDMDGDGAADFVVVLPELEALLRQDLLLS